MSREGSSGPRRGVEEDVRNVWIDASDSIRSLLAFVDVVVNKVRCHSENSIEKRFVEKVKLTGSLLYKEHVDVVIIQRCERREHQLSQRVAMGNSANTIISATNTTATSSSTTTTFFSSS